MNNQTIKINQGKEYPKVCIVILNWNDNDATINCLKSINQMDYPAFEVLLIDNASEEDIKNQIINLSPKVTFLRNNQNYGYTGGNNIGLDYATDHEFDYVWLINNDATIDSCCLKHLIEAVQYNDEIGLASPIIYNNIIDKELLFCGRLINIEKCELLDTKQLSELEFWQTSLSNSLSLSGTALLINSNLIRKIGGLDNTFFAYYEDVDYSVRSIDAGFKNVIVTTAIMYHERKEKRFQAFPVHYHYYMTRNEYVFWNKHLINKKGYKRKFVAEAITKVIQFHDRHQPDSANAALDGLWCALRGYCGSWEDRKKAPTWLQKSISDHRWIWQKMANLIKP